jgi:UDP-glucose 4-epimerase
LGHRDVPVVPAAADDVRDVSLDPSATGAAFGWRARVSFDDTIKRQLQWYDQHGVSDVHSHLRPAADPST